jgi:hypothetical protein
MASPSSVSVLARFAIVSILGCVAGCTPPAAPPPPPQATAPASCVALPNYAVVEVVKQPQSDAKRVADNCWWQHPVSRIHSNVDGYLGWELCNTCDVDIEFKFSDLPGQALTGCNIWIDASNATQFTIAAGQVDVKHCRGLQEVKDEYMASARAGTGQFVDSDPELEIEGVPLQGTGRLAQISNRTQCLSAPSAPGGRRLSVSGRFVRMNATSAIVLVPSGPGLFSTTWGADLVEFASTTGKALGPDEGPVAFTVTADLPSYVTEFVLRDGGPGARVSIADTEQCR